MTRSSIFAATALTLSLAMAVPALGQQVPGGRANAHASNGAGMRGGGGNVGGVRMGGAPQANFRGGQASVGGSQFVGRGNGQFAQRGAYRGGEFRGGRGFGRDIGVAAGVTVGSALALGGFGYDPYSYGDTYAYDNGPNYDPGYTVTYDQPVVDQSVIIGQSAGVDPSYCAQRYRSYDPASGTYLGYDGLRHPCP